MRILCEVFLFNKVFFFVCYNFGIFPSWLAVHLCWTDIFSPAARQALRVYSDLFQSRLMSFGDFWVVVQWAEFCWVSRLRWISRHFQLQAQGFLNSLKTFHHQRRRRVWHSGLQCVFLRFSYCSVLLRRRLCLQPKNKN
jgi:hypothetical protein